MRTNSSIATYGSLKRLGESSRVALEPAALGYAILRMTIGLVVFFYGVGKLVGGRAEFVATLDRSFAASYLPAVLVHLFGQVLPFLEIAIGLCVALGMGTVVTLPALGALLLALTVGKAVIGDTRVVAENLTFMLVVYLLLVRTECNRWSVDQLWRAAVDSPVE